MLFLHLYLSWYGIHQTDFDSNSYIDFHPSVLLKYFVVLDGCQHPKDNKNEMNQSMYLQICTNNLLTGKLKIKKLKTIANLFVNCNKNYSQDYE